MFGAVTEDNYSIYRLNDSDFLINFGNGRYFLKSGGARYILEDNGWHYHVIKYFDNGTSKPMETLVSKSTSTYDRALGGVSKIHETLQYIPTIIRSFKTKVPSSIRLIDRDVKQPISATLVYPSPKNELLISIDSNPIAVLHALEMLYPIKKIPTSYKVVGEVRDDTKMPEVPIKGDKNTQKIFYILDSSVDEHTISALFGDYRNFLRTRSINGNSPFSISLKIGDTDRITNELDDSQSIERMLEEQLPINELLDDDGSPLKSIIHNDALFSDSSLLKHIFYGTTTINEALYSYFKSENALIIPESAFPSRNKRRVLENRNEYPLFDISQLINDLETVGSAS